MIISVVIGAAYYIIAIGQWGTTIGGRVMSIKVVDAYLMAFWDRNKQTWHDKVAGTFVVKP